MVDQRYIDYIKQNMGTYPVESLKSQLINVGVPQDEIDAAIDAATDAGSASYAQVQVISSTANEAPEQAEETTRGSTTVMYRSIYHKLLITNKRLIFANIGGTGGWYFWLGWVGLLISTAIINKKSKEFDSLTPESVFRSDKHNIEVKLGDINSIEFKTPGFLSSGKLIIHYMDSTRKDFGFQDKNGFNEALGLFKDLMPEKIRQGK